MPVYVIVMDHANGLRKGRHTRVAIKELPGNSTATQLHELLQLQRAASHGSRTATRLLVSLGFRGVVQKPTHVRVSRFGNSRGSACLCRGEGQAHACMCMRAQVCVRVCLLMHWVLSYESSVCACACACMCASACV